MLKVPIGIADFRELRQGGYYYVDKSELIREVIEHPAKALLLPRPRRFGKTLNLSMLRYFFDAGCDASELFEDLAIGTDQATMAHAGGYPTVFLTFKDIRYQDWAGCLGALSLTLSQIFHGFSAALAAAKPTELEQEMIQKILAGTAPEWMMQRSLEVLIQLLFRATQKPIVLLVDEYDAPIHAGFNNGYKREIVNFMGNLLGGAFKDNPQLKKGVITGVLRVARDSVFSGLNNLKVYSLLDEPFSTRFGFTEVEVQQILRESGQLEREPEVRDWYNGYHFGSGLIYNPWSILNMMGASELDLQAHWVNTSDNQLIQNLVKSGGISLSELEHLLRRLPLLKWIDPAIVLDELTPKRLWSLLVFSGYLSPLQAGEQQGCYELVIPNREVAMFFEQTLRHWLEALTRSKGLAALYRALLSCDINELSHQFSELVKQVLSYYDTSGETPERVYHAFFLGLLVDLRDRFELVSNRESGYGRFDLALIPRQVGSKGFLLEFKRSENANMLQETARRALEQMQQNDYAAIFVERGVQEVALIGVALAGKRVAVHSQTIYLPKMG